MNTNFNALYKLPTVETKIKCLVTHRDPLTGRFWIEECEAGYRIDGRWVLSDMVEFL